MNKYKLLLVILLTVIIGLLVYLAFFKKPSVASLNVPQSEMPSNETQIGWIGPGLYYGYWFDSQDEYNNWYNNNYRNNYNRDNAQRNQDQSRAQDAAGNSHMNDGGRSGGGMRSGGGGGRGR